MRRSVWRTGPCWVMAGDFLGAAALIRPSGTFSREREKGIRHLPAEDGLLERIDAGEFAADHQLVDGLGALVGDHRLHVERVADGGVLGRDAGAAEQVAAL